MEEAVAFLVATSEPLKGHRFPITPQGILVGREDDCDVVIPSDGVSRQHARVLLHNGAVWVQDQGSRNGVFVNEKRVVRHKQLSPGDALLVGEQTFTIEVVMLPIDPTQSVTHASMDTAAFTGPPGTPPPLPPKKGMGIVTLLIVGVLVAVAGVMLLTLVQCG